MEGVTVIALPGSKRAVGEERIDSAASPRQ
ncbi:hypothetical protein AWB71_01057 [Caballeronia peredens]|nr:hypothetical protein AWB71_01057 [Caballeronia peredens]